MPGFFSLWGTCLAQFWLGIRVFTCFWLSSCFVHLSVCSPDSTSEDTSLPTAPLGDGLLALPSLWPQGHRGKGGKRPGERSVTILSPKPLLQKPPTLKAASGNVGNVSAQGLEGSRAGSESPQLDMHCQGPRHMGFILGPQPGTVSGTEQTRSRVCCQKQKWNCWTKVKGEILHSSAHSVLQLLVYGVWHIGTAAETSAQETKHHTRRAGELRFIQPAGPEELTL